MDTTTEPTSSSDLSFTNTEVDQLLSARDKVGEETFIAVINQIGALLDAQSRTRAAAPDIESTVECVLSSREIEDPIQDTLELYFKRIGESVQDENEGEAQVGQRATLSEFGIEE